MAEDVVQETLIKALQQWSYRGIPQNPEGWLWQTAKNHALDILRREARLRKKLAGGLMFMEPEQTSAREDAVGHPLDDDPLNMMFIGCHPSLSRESQIALLLKTVGGFSTSEIAHAFLLPEATIAQRLVRAKNKLKAENVHFEMPAETDFPRRLDVVLDVLYLIFNEGYESHQGNVPVRKELCEEALYLCRTITEHPAGNTPKTLALLALMYLQASRLNARMDTEGNILLLAEQDRSLWDQEMIGSGLYYLGLSAEGEEMSTYHLQASIAAKHALAKDYENTDWAGILEDYEGLMQINPTPIVMLNHAVALSMIKGNAAGLHALLQLKDQPALRTYSLFYATCGELYERDGKIQLAEENFSQALTLTENESARRFLEKKIQSIKNARQ